MGVVARPRVDNDRSRVHFVKSSGKPATGPVAAELIYGSTGDCPELDCIRALSAGNVIEDAERRAGWILLLTPAHWLLLSLAAWRALDQLVFAPYAWEKTEHGQAKSSRRAAN